MALCRELGVPRVTVGSLKKRRKKKLAQAPNSQQLPLSPTYSLERSRTTLRRAPTARAGPRPARVSSGPTGMYTEHVAWARTLTKQPSRIERSKSELAAVPILAFSD